MRPRIGAGKERVVSIRHGSPARAAYAAAEAPALPDEESTMPPRPAVFAHETPTLARRSLNDHVGLADSFFSIRRGSPIDAPKLGLSIKGVPPSPSDTASAALTGRHSSYRHRPAGRPCQRALSDRPRLAADA